MIFSLAYLGRRTKQDFVEFAVNVSKTKQKTFSYYTKAHKSSVIQLRKLIN